MLGAHSPPRSIQQNEPHGSVTADLHEEGTIVLDGCPANYLCNSTHTDFLNFDGCGNGRQDPSARYPGIQR